MRELPDRDILTAEVDGFRSSPALRYKFGTSTHYADRFISPKERLILDATEYIKSQDVSAFAEVRDSLEIFGMLISWPIYWGASDLNKMLWDIETFQRIDRVYKHWMVDESGEVHIEDVPGEIASLEDLMSEYARQQYVCSGKNVAANVFVPDRDKILRYPNMRAVLERLRRSTADPEVKTVMAALYISVDQEDRAVEAYRSKRPIEPYEHYNLGTIYLIKENDTVMAKEQFENALELREARYNLGVAYLREGDWVRAAEQFERLAEPLDIDSIEIKTVEGVLLDHVIKQYSCNNLGVCRYHTNGIGREALDWFEKASSWRQVTGRPDGVYNMRYMQEKLLEIAEGPGKPARARMTARNFLKVTERIDDMHKVYDEIERVAPINLIVLITGEPGVGKTEMARAIHKAGPNKDKEFVPIDCTKLSEDLIEREFFKHGSGTGCAGKSTPKFSDGDTLFISDVCDMDERLLRRLLRAVEHRGSLNRSEKESEIVNVRLLFATARDLEEEVRKKRFREDIYYLLSEYTIHIPSIKDKKRDVALLAAYFKDEYIREYQKGQLCFSKHVLEFMERYDWPGNVTELRNAVQRAVIRAEGGVIHLRDLREVVKELLKKSKDNEGKKLTIEAILKETNGNISEAARQMDMERSWFNRNIKNLQINAEKYRSDAATENDACSPPIQEEE